jgi:hypothetical protein
MSNKPLGWAWVALCLAMSLHTADEATHRFLAVYNPTVLGLRMKAGWLPFPTFEFTTWLVGLILVNILLLALSVFVFQGARWMRPLAYIFAGIMTLNAIGHTAGTVFGRTLESVRFPRPMPGFYSSPILLAASLYLLYQLRAAPAGDETPIHHG